MFNKKIICFFSLRILGTPKGVPFLGFMERVGNSRVEVYKKVVRYLKGLLNGMKCFYFSDESPSNPPGNTRQFARAIEYSITIHNGTVPSTRLNIDSYLSWTIE